MSRRTVAAWVVVAPAALWAAVRLFGLERGFPLVPLLAFTPYAAVASAVACLVALALRRRAPALVAGVSALLLAAVLVPRVVPGDGSGTSGERIRVLSANVAAGSVPPEALVRLVRRTRPDVLSVQELTPRYAGRLEAAGLRRGLPHAVLEPRRLYAGTGLYARDRLRARPPIEAIFTMAVARVPARDYEIVAVHPAAPLRANTMAAWRRGLRALPPAPAGEGPLRILAGDFNATLDHAELRRLVATGYDDAAEEVGAGLRPTWPSGTRRTPPVTIDHVLADERAVARTVSIHELPGSDHKAVLAELVREGS